MLGRTANALYWMFRYLERVDNTARMIDAGLRMALTRDLVTSEEEWRSVIAAAGQRTEGSATLTKAMETPSLRPQALFNRGNSALAANALDHAIRDYTEALRLVPGDREVKRNLEIALRRRESMERQQKGGGQKEQQQPAGRQPRQQPDRGEKEEGQADAEALLRSVQQQEQEELARMKRARGESRRVGG